MIIDQVERDLYLKVKNRFINEKGLIVFVEVDDQVFASPSIHYLRSDQELSDKVYQLQASETSYAIFNYTKNQPTYFFFGKTFFQEEIIATQKVLEFRIRRKKMPMDLSKVREELKILAEMLGASKAS